MQQADMTDQAIDQMAELVRCMDIFANWIDDSATQITLVSSPGDPGKPDDAERWQRLIDTLESIATSAAQVEAACRHWVHAGRIRLLAGGCK